MSTAIYSEQVFPPRRPGATEQQGITIYLGGRLRGDGDYRANVCNITQDKAFYVGHDGTYLEGVNSALFRSYQVAGRHFNVTGPWFVGDNHVIYDEAAHGTRNVFGDYEVAAQDIHAACLQGIKLAEVCFFWIDDYEAHGTLVEIGYAHALGRRIVIGTTNELIAPRKDWKMPELWFALRCASHVITAANPSEALRHFATRCL